MLNPSSGFEENDHKDYLMEMHNRTINNKINLNAREIELIEGIAKKTDKKGYVKSIKGYLS